MADLNWMGDCHGNYPKPPRPTEVGSQSHSVWRRLPQGQNPRNKIMLGTVVLSIHSIILSDYKFSVQCVLVWLAYNHRFRQSGKKSKTHYLYVRLCYDKSLSIAHALDAIA